MTVKFQVNLDTSLPPDIILNAYTDFGPRRTERWTMLSKKLYKVNQVGDTWADVVEGSDKPIEVWAHERYDWSKPGTIRWTVLDSNFSVAGHSMEVRVTPRNGGSHFTLLYERGVYGLKGYVAGFMMTIFGK